MGEPVVLASEFKALELPVPPVLRTHRGAAIDRIRLSCRMGPVRRRKDSIRTSLLVEAQYLLASGEAWATERIGLPVTFRRDGRSWRCQVGPDYTQTVHWPA